MDIWLVVWNMNFIFPHILGMSSFQLTKSMIFQRGGWLNHQPVSYGHGYIVLRFFFVFFPGIPGFTNDEYRKTSDLLVLLRCYFWVA
jgi:hypothetical protein